MRGLGCLTPLSLTLSGLALVLVVAGVFLTGGRMFSPGGLNDESRTDVALGGVRSHAALGGDCASCHAPPWDAGGMVARCLTCHSDVTTQLNDPTTLHGAMREGQACLACHTEHGGATAVLTHMNPDAFDHAQLGFALDAHATTSDGQPFACADCHTALTQQPRPVGAAAYAAPATACVECHQQEDAAFMAAHTADFGPVCLGCHDGLDRFSAFDHTSVGFVLDGAHATARCSLCHASARNAEGFAGAPTACVGCHAEPEVHLGQFGNDCASCHTTQTWEGASFEHPFPLDHGARTKQPCVTCHLAAPNYQTYSCYSCHAHNEAAIVAEHREEGISNIADCVRCHATGREDEGEGGESGD